MVGRMVIASMLAAVSLTSYGHGAEAAVEESKALWPHMHRCTLDPVDQFAINTKETGANSGRGGQFPGEVVVVIALHLVGTSGSGAGPVISAHAINTKGTGANNGRASVDHAINTKGTGGSKRPGAAGDSAVGVACTAVDVASDRSAQAAANALAAMSTGGAGVGWSCSVSGPEERPVFQIRVLAGRPGEISVSRAAVDGWSLGASNDRMALVGHVVGQGGNGRVACSSDKPRVTSYDLAVMK